MDFWQAASAAGPSRQQIDSIIRWPAARADPGQTPRLFGDAEAFSDELLANSLDLRDEGVGNLRVELRS